jgi:hypothetical protein
VGRLDLEALADERLEPGRRAMERVAFGHVERLRRDPTRGRASELVSG